MIIGNGLIAREFQNFKHLEVVYFASGVANSTNPSQSDFYREENLLLESQKSGKPLVYFSTTSIELESKAGLGKLGNYQVHKLRMEDLVRREKHLIIRLPNVVGKGANPLTLVEYLSRKVQTGGSIEVQTEAKRSIIDVSDVASMVNLLVSTNELNKTVSIVNPLTHSILEIVYILQDIHKKNAQIVLKSGGENFKFDSMDTMQLASQLNIDFNEKYLNELLWKYYE
ncbi:WcaG Nucleoside-diphosphate-sugar epimerases [Candidatus Nanopelagicaceae bacterium]